MIITIILITTTASQQLVCASNVNSQLTRSREKVLREIKSDIWFQNIFDRVRLNGTQQNCLLASYRYYDSRHKQNV